MSEDLSKTGDLSSISDEFLKEITTATFNSLNDLYKRMGEIVENIAGKRSELEELIKEIESRREKRKDAE